MKRGFIGLAAFLIVFGGVVLSAVPASAQEGDGCALDTNSRMNDERRTAVSNVRAAHDDEPAENFSCQNVSGVSDTIIRGNCVTGLCAGGANNRCCVPGTAAARPGAAGDGPSETTETTRGPAAGLVLPECVRTGNCGLDDIIRTGVNFANFLFGISGAVFLAIFVYAGVLYLTAGGSTDRVSKAKRMLTQATIGMLLVIGAGVMVTFIYNAFRGGTADRCEAAHEGFQCTELPSANLSEEIRNRGCVTGLCPGADTNVCCPSE